MRLVFKVIGVAAAITLGIFILFWINHPTNLQVKSAAPPAIPPVQPKVEKQQIPTNSLAFEPDKNWDWTNSIPIERRAEAIQRVKQMAQIVSVANVPIVFYGKIVDQNDQPVEGVHVEAVVYGWNVIGLMQHVARAKTNILYSDSQGKFVVSGMNGESLSFHFEKEGHELALGSLGGYGYGPGVSIHHEPDPTKPVVYHMWKRQGAVELKGVSFKGMIPSDGQSVWISENSDYWSRAKISDAIVKLTASRERPIVTFADKSPYKWGFEIDMLGGGIQKTTDLFLYQAPGIGYNSILSISHEAGDSNWIREQTLIFYFKTNKGKYGRGEVFISNWENQSEIYCRISIALNPDGNRNLEPKPE